MPIASCLCGNFKASFDGEPAAKLACHCLPCRKTSGTLSSLNAVFPDDRFRILSGKDVTYTRKGESGKDVTYHNCSTCYNLLYVRAEALPSMVILKMGMVDDTHDGKEILCSWKPSTEAYTRNRVGWPEALQGANDIEGGS